MGCQLQSESIKWKDPEINNARGIRERERESPQSHNYHTILSPHSHNYHTILLQFFYFIISYCSSLTVPKVSMKLYHRCV